VLPARPWTCDLCCGFCLQVIQRGFVGHHTRCSRAIRHSTYGGWRLPGVRAWLYGKTLAFPSARLPAEQASAAGRAAVPQTRMPRQNSAGRDARRRCSRKRVFEVLGLPGACASYSREPVRRYGIVHSPVLCWCVGCSYLIGLACGGRLVTGVPVHERRHPMAYQNAGFASETTIENDAAAEELFAKVFWFAYNNSCLIPLSTNLAGVKNCYSANVGGGLGGIRDLEERRFCSGTDVGDVCSVAGRGSITTTGDRLPCLVGDVVTNGGVCCAALVWLCYPYGVRRCALFSRARKTAACGCAAAERRGGERRAWRRCRRPQRHYAVQHMNANQQTVLVRGTIAVSVSFAYYRV